ncbi:hypothetical protein [Bradyrhizobium liaoningense]
MISGDSWIDAIGAEHDQEGQLTLRTVIAHIRGAVIETGFVSLGRITLGLKEAYRPLSIDEDVLGKTVKEAIRVLLLSGDIDEFATSAGRGYAATPPRRVVWKDSRAVLLGRSLNGSSQSIVRHLASDEVIDDAVTITLSDELGRPEWRSALVEFNAADVVDGNVGALFEMASSLATSGERYSLDEPETIAVLSGRGKYFGQAEPVPSGRWQRPSESGCFPAVIKTGYSFRNVVLNIDNGSAKLWHPASLDLWRWVVVGFTIARGDPVTSYESSSQRLDFLTPPPRQLQRIALLTGSQIGPWSWTIDADAYGIIVGALGA